MLLMTNTSSKRPFLFNILNVNNTSIAKSIMVNWDISSVFILLGVIWLLQSGHEHVCWSNNASKTEIKIVLKLKVTRDFPIGGLKTIAVHVGWLDCTDGMGEIELGYQHQTLLLSIVLLQVELLLHVEGSLQVVLHHFCLLAEEFAFRCNQ